MERARIQRITDARNVISEGEATHYDRTLLSLLNVVTRTQRVDDVVIIHGEPLHIHEARSRGNVDVSRRLVHVKPTPQHPPRMSAAVADGSIRVAHWSER